MTGHNLEECWARNANRNSWNNRTIVVCKRCGRVGHATIDCRMNPNRPGNQQNSRFQNSFIVHPHQTIPNQRALMNSKDIKMYPQNEYIETLTLILHQLIKHQQIKLKLSTTKTISNRQLHSWGSWVARRKSKNNYY